MTLERKGTPGKLEFTVVKGPGLNFAEGDPVKLTVNGTAMFYGFVFKKMRDKGGTIDVVAYDQLRYLKNKDTITEEGLKASDPSEAHCNRFPVEPWHGGRYQLYP